MFSAAFLIGLAAAPLANCQLFEAVYHVDLNIRQATTTPPTTASDNPACHLPESLRDNSIYADQPTGSQDLLTWMRALPCVPAACCIPASLSQDWADYVSDSNSWWSDHSSVAQARTEAVVSWYSSAAELPACAGLVHPITTTPLANPDDPLGHTCPTATSDLQAGASATTSAETNISSLNSSSISTSGASTNSSSLPDSSTSSSPTSSGSVATVSSSSADDLTGASFIIGSSFSHYVIAFFLGTFALAIGL